MPFQQRVVLSDDVVMTGWRYPPRSHQPLVHLPHPSKGSSEAIIISSDEEVDGVCLPINVFMVLLDVPQSPPPSGRRLRTNNPHSLVPRTSPISQGGRQPQTAVVPIQRFLLTSQPTTRSTHRTFRPLENG